MMRSLAAFRVFSPLRRAGHAVFRLLPVAALALSLHGCGLLPEQVDETAGWSANKLYAEAKDAQADGAWDKAAKTLEKLESRYPYGRYAQQAQMELGYIYWKGGEIGSALAACDRFIKLHPNHPAADYVHYLKGLINFNEDLGYAGYISKQDPTERDPKAAREAFDSFKELVTRFPNSKYTPDATKRLNYLVNALASQEIHVARYYMKREAYIAAVNRAQFVVKTYPQAPAVEEALFIMGQGYAKLGMPELQQDAERVLQKTFPTSELLSTNGPGNKTAAWWKFWN